MSDLNKVEGKPDPWDTGELGQDERHVRRASPEKEAEIYQALGLDLNRKRLEMVKQLSAELKAEEAQLKSIMQARIEKVPGPLAISFEANGTVFVIKVTDISKTPKLVSEEFEGEVSVKTLTHWVRDADFKEIGELYRVAVVGASAQFSSEA